MRMSVTLASAAAIAWASAGCDSGGDGLPREPVAGEVALDGRPIDLGLITFTPEAGGEPVVSGVIEGGRFQLDRADGPVPGPHRVDIRARAKTGRKIEDPDNPGVFHEEIREAVPPRYNVRSMLKAEVRPGEDNRFEFALAGQKSATKGRRR